jgi:aryl-alcohol dehydrogenase-like predicted oxidoreductase
LVPGTKRRTYLEENVKAVNVELSKEQLAEINAEFSFGAATGERYVDAGMKMLNG